MGKTQSKEKFDLVAFRKLPKAKQERLAKESLMRVVVPIVNNYLFSRGLDFH